MADDTSIAPEVAAKVANNAYYTLGNWSAYKAAGEPEGMKQHLGGAEARGTVEHEVVGGGAFSVPAATLGDTFEARTGWTAKTSSGFGYFLELNGGSDIVVATRGTRPEMPRKPDLWTDARFTPTAVFQDVGPIHKGFKDTFDTIRPSLDAGLASFRRPGVQCIHCVGHSLGGALANLIAYYVKGSVGEKCVKLYTFGAPRVGMFLLYGNKVTNRLGKDNIYRISHTWDPITMIPTIPFQHVLPSDRDANNIILASPANGPVMANHNMVAYHNESVGKTWGQLRGESILWSWEDRLWAKWWKSDSGWFKKGLGLIGSGIAWILLKILKGLLKLFVGSLIVIATPIDLICQIIYKAKDVLGKIGKKVWEWITMAGRWILGKAVEAKDATVGFLRHLLNRLIHQARVAGEAALDALADYGRASMPLAVYGAGIPIFF